MKKYLLVSAVVMIMYGCTNQQILDEETAQTREYAQFIKTKNQCQEDSALVSCEDPALQASVGKLLQNKMTEYACNKGMVYVVETATGAIKAHVSLANKEKRYVPYEDTYKVHPTNA